MDLKGKVAIVTGGASGLGEGVVRRFCDDGVKVAIFDRNEKLGNKLADELADKAIFCSVDVADDNSVSAGVEKTMNAFGAIHICVNCAGRSSGATKTLSRKGRFPMDLYRDVININLIGTFNVLSHAAEKIALNEPDENGERGIIINTASIAAYEGQPGQVAYAASKGGIVAMTLTIARDLAYYGIRSVTLAPGLCETPILAGVSPEVKEGLSKAIPFPKRLAEPSEFAALAVHVVENSYINGETIRLDGGLRL